MGLLSRIFDDNARDIRKYNKVVSVINSFETDLKFLSDVELAAKTQEFRMRLENGESEKKLLPEAFAVVREAARRTLSMRHFDAQLIGGMVLADGRISEMKTGEGKTLVATAPAYLHALSGKGVHVITVNDYLAKRDSEWMGRVYKFLGLSVGLIIHGLDNDQRRQSYAKDITYGTNNEFGFDYLRDNMALQPENMVQRPLNYAVVDEVDSILIDEARTPLIISGPSDKPTDLYYKVAKIIPRLKDEDDYTLDEKVKAASLTEEGISRVEKMLGLENLYDPENSEISHHVNQALKAHTLYKRDRDYVVKDGQVIIVDEFRGRLMFGRRYSEGLHQAIEAKENVKIERESQTLASITFQNYFRMYEKLSGMTGTAKTEEEEFRKIYKMDVVEVPTNLPMIRKDNKDIVYRTQIGKFNAVVEDIIKENATGRPILVGTISIERSEVLSNMLKKRGIAHKVLNAKFHEQEAEIIAQAGRLGAVTIATNMAGRGTDISLGGSYQSLAEQEMAENPEKEYSDEERLAIIERYKKQTEQEHEEVKKLGGLYIIGTERHESRRIDNQLRGRAGRQGDPGASRFYLSMEDDLMRLFGGDNLSNILDKVGMDDDTPIDSNVVTRSIETAQKRVENRNFEIRKNVLDYDDVMNQQREIIYAERRRALYGEDLHESIKGMIDAVIDRIFAATRGESDYPEEWDLAPMVDGLSIYVFDPLPTVEELSKLACDEIPEVMKKRVQEYYDKRQQEMGEELMQQLERLVTLKVVDAQWMGHLDAMDQLRQGIGLRGYGQRDPLVEYKYEAYDMFQAMIEEIQAEVVRLSLTLQIIEQAQPTERKTVENRYEDDAVKKPIIKDKAQQIGRNAPCPCGSGKKYKKCCGLNE